MKYSCTVKKSFANYFTGCSYILQKHFLNILSRTLNGYNYVLNNSWALWDFLRVGCDPQFVKRCFFFNSDNGSSPICDTEYNSVVREITEKRGEPSNSRNCELHTRFDAWGRLVFTWGNYGRRGSPYKSSISCVVRWKSTDVSERYVSSIFRVEE
jgi:hypothetical protein